jgi:hypothetical protein
MEQPDATALSSRHQGLRECAGQNRPHGKVEGGQHHTCRHHGAADQRCVRATAIGGKDFDRGPEYAGLVQHGISAESFHGAGCSKMSSQCVLLIVVFEARSYVSLIRGEFVRVNLL